MNYVIYILHTKQHALCNAQMTMFIYKMVYKTNIIKLWRKIYIFYQDLVVKQIFAPDTNIWTFSLRNFSLHVKILKF